MTRPVLWLLRLADRVLQVLVPPRPDRIAWISAPDHVGNAYHLYRHVVTTRRDLEHVWLVADPAARDAIEAEFAALGGPAAGHRLRVVERRRLGGYVAYLRSRWVFHTHGAYRTTQWAFRREIVSLWHGMPIKAIGALNHATPNPYPTFGTRHVASSHLLRYLIAAVFRTSADDVVVAGLPRCDVLAAPHPCAPDRAAIVRTLDVDPDRRLVLWLPTYRVAHTEPLAGDGPARSFVDDLPAGTWDRLVASAERTGCTLVVKLHPDDRLDPASLPTGDHVRVLGSAAWVALGVELYDVLAVTDGLISDLSSVAIDYLVTSRPIGLVGFDPETYPRDVLFPVALLADSRRVHDLADVEVTADFFDRVRDATPVAAAEDDLARWLVEDRDGTGCETLLAALDPPLP